MFKKIEVRFNMHGDFKGEYHVEFNQRVFAGPAEWNVEVFKLAYGKNGLRAEQTWIPKVVEQGVLEIKKRLLIGGRGVRA